MQTMTCDICGQAIILEDQPYAKDALAFNGKKYDLCANCRTWIDNGINSARASRGQHRKTNRVGNIIGNFINGIRGAAENYARNNQ